MRKRMKNEKKRQLADGKGGVGEEGRCRAEESYDCKEAWASINHSILSGHSPCPNALLSSKGAKLIKMPVNILRGYF
jgi:hypothetical protein